MANFTVTTLSDTTAADGFTSLREALTLANANANADTVTFADGLKGGKLVLTQGELAITHTVVIDGDLNNDAVPDITVDANGLSRVVTMAGTGAAIGVTIDGLTLTGGASAANASGAGIRAQNVDLTLTYSSVQGNYTSALGSNNDGGGVFALGGTTTLNHSTVSRNATFTSESEGGGIAAINGKLTLIDSTVSNNHTFGKGSEGGGISTLLGTTVLVKSKVSDNGSYGDQSNGGGIDTHLGKTTLDHSTVSGNHTVQSSGGGFNATDADVKITDSTLIDNHTGQGLDVYFSTATGFAGGGFSAHGGTASITGSVVSGNSTNGYYSGGGGIANYAGKVTITNSTVSGNETQSQESHGGGIFTRSGTTTIDASTVNSNSVHFLSFGGGVAGYTGTVTITNSTVSSNVAQGRLGSGLPAAGGGIYGYASNLKITNSTVSGNAALTGDDKELGGGIFTAGHDDANNILTLTNSIVVGNSAAIDAEISGNAYTSHSSLIGGDAKLIFAQTAPVAGTSVLGGVLADNGGPTRTIALRDIASNPALSAADPAFASAADQRGQVRPEPAGTKPDLGAFELNQGGLSNQPPNAKNDAVTTGEDAVLRINAARLLANDRDPNGDPLTITAIDTDGTAGSVRLNPNGSVRYDPHGRFDYLNDGDTASDSFVYTVSDGHGGMDTATVTVTITGADEQIVGTGRRDRLEGSDFDDTIRGLGGNDRIDGNKGDDCLFGGRGSDRFVFDVADQEPGGRDTIEDGDFKGIGLAGTRGLVHGDLDVVVIKGSAEVAGIADEGGDAVVTFKNGWELAFADTDTNTARLIVDPPSPVGGGFSAGMVEDGFA